LIILAISTTIPAGVFSPCFTLGAVFGRCYGYLLKNIGVLLGIELIKRNLRYLNINFIIDEGIYAIIGAAAFSGSVTRTTSVAMIVFELTGQTSHMIPILVGVLLSYAVSNSLAMSVYDVMLEMKNLPFLPSLTSVSTYNHTARDLMNKNFLYLT
jgi:H+/Cl- antiporter ClcA